MSPKKLARFAPECTVQPTTTADHYGARSFGRNVERERCAGAALESCRERVGQVATKYILVARGSELRRIERVA
jgi:hypothetical protein